VIYQRPLQQNNGQSSTNTVRLTIRGIGADRIYGQLKAVLASLVHGNRFKDLEVMAAQSLPLIMAEYYKETQR